MSLILSSTIKEKSKEESFNRFKFLWTIKQGISGSILVPLEIAVPFPEGFKNDLTYNGISFFCNGCNVFGWITEAP